MFQSAFIAVARLTKSSPGGFGGPGKRFQSAFIAVARLTVGDQGALRRKRVSIRFFIAVARLTHDHRATGIGWNEFQSAFIAVARLTVKTMFGFLAMACVIVSIRFHRGGPSHFSDNF